MLALGLFGLGFTQADRDNIRNSLIDPDGGGDIIFLLWAMTTYSVVRIATEIALPNNIRGYTSQQYIVTLGHQAVVLPCIVVGWALGLFPEAPELIYLLTGAYLASDSVINYSPVSGCVAGSARKPTFSWSVHAHHVFTVILCLLGPNLPPWPVVEGAVCILLGEAGSLWITVTLLRPNETNFVIRFWSFLVSRVAGILIAVDIARQIEALPTRVLLLAMVLGLIYDNSSTLKTMWTNAQKGGEGNWPL